MLILVKDENSSLSQYMLQCLWKLFSLKSEHIPPISIDKSPLDPKA